MKVGTQSRPSNPKVLGPSPKECVQQIAAIAPCLVWASAALDQGMQGKTDRGQMLDGCYTQLKAQPLLLCALLAALDLLGARALPLVPLLSWCADSIHGATVQALASGAQISPGMLLPGAEEALARLRKQQGAFVSLRWVCMGPGSSWTHQPLVCPGR